MNHRYFVVRVVGTAKVGFGTTQEKATRNLELHHGKQAPGAQLEVWAHDQPLQFETRSQQVQEVGTGETLLQPLCFEEVK